MKQWIEDLKQRPAIAHLLRAVERFSSRLGSQFAAAITYFSVLSMVPILMFGFAVLGMTVTVLRPDWLGQIQDAINAQFASSTDLGPKINQIIETALNSWGTVGAVGLLTAMWSGAGWVASLKSAVRAQWRADFDLAEHKANIVVETLKNLGILVTLLVAVGATFVASSAATALADTLFRSLQLDQIPGGGFLLRFVPVLVSLVFGFGLFFFLYRVLPETKAPTRDLLQGALIGSIGLAVLQYATGALIGVFSGNAAAALFGPVIVLMLFFNLFATLILIVAAWIATAKAPVTVTPAPDPQPVLLPPAPRVVNEAVAKKAMGVGLGTGYVVGAATGVGLGAVIAAVAGWIGRLRRRPR